MTGQPLWVIPWEGSRLNRKSLRALKLSRKNRYAARWVLIAREADRAALPRWVHPIASLRRARLGRLNLMTVPQELTPRAKAEECLAAGEAEGIRWISVEKPGNICYSECSMGGGARCVRLHHKRSDTNEKAAFPAVGVDAADELRPGGGADPHQYPHHH